MSAFARFFAISGELLAITDHDGMLRCTNPAWERVLGYSAPELEGISIADLVADEDKPAIIRWLAPQVAPGMPMTTARLRGKDGRLQSFLLHLHAGQEPGELYLVARERHELVLTTRELAEEEHNRLVEYTTKLERRNRELERFASVASHDLQEPLRKIQAFSGRLKLKLEEQLPDEGRDYLRRIQDAARRMQSLINDLLMYSRLATTERRNVRVNLDSIVRQVMGDLEVRIEETGGEVRVGPLPSIDADPVQMRQLFQNLIANALKFHHPEVAPVVTIAAELVPTGEPAGGAEMYRITIADNGIGIEPRFFERIFGIFERLHHRGAYEGTGVGLALCRKIAEQHGGSISVSSTAGEGATFTILLPRAPSRKADAI